MSSASSHNRLAVYAHRGWASSVIVSHLAKSGAPLKILYRPGSDVSKLPESVETVEVDLADEDKVVQALENVDILLSLVGHSGVDAQKYLLAALPRTNVQLFVPSDLAARYDPFCTANIPVNQRKAEIEREAKEKGIKTSVVLVGNFAEFALNTPAMGVDLKGNRVILTGDAASNSISLCTKDYVGTAYAQLFAQTPIEQLLVQNEFVLSELILTGSDLLTALRAKHGQEPEVRHAPTQKMVDGIAQGSPFALAFVCRLNWANGTALSILGPKEQWVDVKGYEKKTLEQLVVDGQLDEYRPLPETFMSAIFG